MALHVEGVVSLDIADQQGSVCQSLDYTSSESRAVTVDRSGRRPEGEGSRSARINANEAFTCNNLSADKHHIEAVRTGTVNLEITMELFVYDN